MTKIKSKIKKGLSLKYFVLNPYKRNIYGKASRLAIKEYARVVREENDVLADDLIIWIRKIEGEMFELSCGERAGSK